VPEVKEIMSVQKALTILSDDSIKLFPCIDKDTIPLPDALENVRATHRVALTIAVFIGPEGDFTKEEMDAAKESGFNLVSLGERVLRTETAGLYVLSVLDYIFG
jgi:16S rRNA (uracil1498-N3)-methyltransferase